MPKPPTLAQQMQALDTDHAARQATAAEPLTVRQTAKMIASIKQNNKGTPAKTLPLTKISKFDKGLKR